MQETATYLAWNIEQCRSYCDSPRRVLVVGCGKGLDCQPFVETAESVVGIDPCEDVGADFQHPAVKYIRGTVESCDLEEGAFDLVFSVAVMEHVLDIKGAFCNMVRACRKGGVVYCFAGDLWYSRQGHHMSCLESIPWGHLRGGVDDITATVRRLGFTRHNGYNVRDWVQWMLTGNYFNRLPGSRYVEVCAGLPVEAVFRNDLWHDGRELLTDEVRRSINPAISDDDLLAASHTFVARC